MASEKEASEESALEETALEETVVGLLNKNTLQYKLNRIHKITGLNPRKFQDAVLLYLAVLLRTNL